MNRNSAEEATGRHDAVLQSVMEATADFIFMKDCDGRYLSINCAVADVLGRPEQEIIGKDDYAIFPREIAERFKREDAETFASGGPCRYENEVPVGGELRYLQTVKSLCRDLNGQVIGIVGISRDITDRRAVDVALLERERDLTEAHRIAKLGTWSWDLKSGQVKWSEEVFRAFGRIPDLARRTTPKSWRCTLPRAAYEWRLPSTVP